MAPPAERRRLMALRLPPGDVARLELIAEARGVETHDFVEWLVGTWLRGESGRREATAAAARVTPSGATHPSGASGQLRLVGDEP